MSKQDLLKLANKGDVDAQVTLGFFYYFGSNEFYRDEEEAFKWFYLAAEQGNGKAQAHVGFMYENNLQNYHEAYKWYYLAYLTGEDTSKYLKKLETESDNFLPGFPKVSQSGAYIAKSEAKRKYNEIQRRNRSN